MDRNIDKSEENKNKGKFILMLILVFIIIILLLFTVIFTIDSKFINIIGYTQNPKEATWNISFDNIKVKRKGSVVVSNVFASNTVIKDFDVEFVRPGDSFEIEFNVTNGGSIDAKLDYFEIKPLSCFYDDGTKALDYCNKNIDYSIAYKNGGLINKGDVLDDGESKTIVFKMKYNSKAPVLIEKYITIEDIGITFIYGQK